MKKTTTALLIAVSFMLSLMAAPVSAAEGEPFLPELSDHYAYHDYIEIAVGEKIDLAPIMPSSSSGDETYPIGPRRWSSKRPEIAAVTDKGVVTALKTGFAEIVVTHTNNRVESVAESVRLFVTEGEAKTEAANILHINIGRRVSVKELLFPGRTGGTFEWAVERSFLAEVDGDGVLEGLVAGSGAVYGIYTDDDGNVTKKAAALKVAAENRTPGTRLKVTLAPGETIDPGRALFPDERQATFDCLTDKSIVATIGEDERATAGKPGDCYITVTATFLWKEELRGRLQVAVK
jgi:hypothetical protein